MNLHDSAYNNGLLFVNFNQDFGEFARLVSIFAFVFVMKKFLFCYCLNIFDKNKLNRNHEYYCGYSVVRLIMQVIIK